MGPFYGNSSIPVQLTDESETTPYGLEKNLFKVEFSFI